MLEPLAFPWFATVASLLDLRRRDRVLILGAGAQAHVRAVLATVGSQGSVTVVEPGRTLAERIAELQPDGLEVLALAPSGHERFGAFDALLSCPTGLPEWPIPAYAELLRGNLRPGGRFALDLPGPESVPDLAAAWSDAGGEAAALSRLAGPDATELSKLLDGGGLREVHAAFGSHLLDLQSPHDLIDLFADALPAAAAPADFGPVLARRLKTTGPVQALVHRTRVHGRR